MFGVPLYLWKAFSFYSEVEVGEAGVLTQLHVWRTEANAMLRGQSDAAAIMELF
jgi:hypothetical protein